MSFNILGTVLYRGSARLGEPKNVPGFFKSGNHLSAMLGRLSIVLRIVLVVAMAGAVALAISVLVVIDNARRTAIAETSANRAMVENYLITTIERLLQDNSPEEVMDLLPSVIHQPHSVRIVIRSTATQPNQILELGTRREERQDIPHWTRRLLAPPGEEMDVPILIRRKNSDKKAYIELLVISEPLDEIQEIWKNFWGFIAIGTANYVVMVFMLLFVVNRLLHPIGMMEKLFRRFEAGDYSIRIGSVPVPEFSCLAKCFDRIAEILEQTIRENKILNLKLVNAREHERKAIALELHDEFGPCLFGLRVEARSILENAGKVGLSELTERAESIDRITEQIQEANQSLLRRLNAMEIGQLELCRLLKGLIARMRKIDESINWNIQISPELKDCSEVSDLTIYRIVQEALFNVLRHANARHIGVVARPCFDNPSQIEILVEDDGCGIQQDARMGMGVQGMKERAFLVGGNLKVTARQEGGTRIFAKVPIVRNADSSRASDK